MRALRAYPPERVLEYRHLECPFSSRDVDIAFEFGSKNLVSVMFYLNKFFTVPTVY